MERGVGWGVGGGILDMVKLKQSSDVTRSRSKQDSLHVSVTSELGKSTVF